MTVKILCVLFMFYFHVIMMEEVTKTIMHI